MIKKINNSIKDQPIYFIVKMGNKLSSMTVVKIKSR
jgi:hypothetical protein